VAAPNQLNDVVDRARAVATKAQETRQHHKKAFVCALASNGKSAESEAGRYARQILSLFPGISPSTGPSCSVSSIGVEPISQHRRNDGGIGGALWLVQHPVGPQFDINFEVQH
jgi:hypothetical protein